MWVRAMEEADASCGGKAQHLARLVAAGLPVPEGFVVEDHAFRFVVGALPADREAIGHALARVALEDAVPAELVAEVRARTEALGVVAVRSSANLEDATDGSGAGVFASVTNVAPRDVWPAIRAVWTSALAPLAVTYARGRPLSIAVIVQRFVPGERITVYTRTPGAPAGTAIVVQRGDDVHELARDAADPIATLALRAEQAIGATAGADVELVEASSGACWVVQARPIVHRVVPAREPPPPALLAALVADGRRWTWDVAHNPDPLSPAQAQLVERVERARVAPWSLRVCAGYLYSAPRVTAATTVASRADLEARAAAIEADFATLLGVDAPSLDAAIARYVQFYARWATAMVPLIAAGRRDVDASRDLAGARSSAVEGTLLAAARGDLDEESAIAQLAPLAPAWDVAVPTFGERPEIVRAAIARARNLVIDHVAASEPRDADVELARAVADLAERDDLWFARAQWMVRRALLAEAHARAISVDDICWLSFDDLDRLSPVDARRRASAARAVHDRAAKWAMPLVIGGEHEDARPVLRGFGSGARVSGRVVRFTSLASAVAVGGGDIIVARAVTPALAVFVVGCAAIISETGGPLDHGAAIARELGIPFVVGCRDAWTLLDDGMLVTIDQDAVIV